MARIAKVVVPEFPHHRTQRGHSSQKVFLRESQYKGYFKLLNWQGTLTSDIFDKRQLLAVTR